MYNLSIPKKKLFEKDTRVGIVDIGSDTIRFQIFENFKNNQIPIFNKKISCGLGKDLASTNELNKNSIKKAINALKYISDILKASAINNVHVIATEAVRVANNSSVFKLKAESILNTSLNVLSGKDEAKYSGLGAIVGIKKSKGIVADLGGGSLELAEVKKKRILNTTSMSFGVHRAISKNKNIYRDFDKELESIDWFSENNFKRLILTGGTWRSLIKIYFVKYDYPLNVIHHFKPNFKLFIEMLEEVSGYKQKELKQISYITKDKTPYIKYASYVALKIIQKSKSREIVISYTALREGYLSNIYNINNKFDPLIHESNKLSKLHNDLEYSYINHAAIYDFCLSFFKNHPYVSRRLLKSSINLTSIGASIDKDEKAQFAFNQILKMELLKFSHSDRIKLATAIYFFHDNYKRDGIKKYKHLINKNSFYSMIALGIFNKISIDIGFLTNFNYQNFEIYIKDHNIIFKIPKLYSDLLKSKTKKSFDTLSKVLKMQQKIVLI